MSKQIEPTVKTFQLDSTCIDTVRYCVATGNLGITFHSGNIYLYCGVSPLDATNLVTLGGSYYNRYIKNKYECSRLA